MKVWVLNEVYADEKFPSVVLIKVHKTKDGALKELRKIYLDIISEPGFKDNVEQYDDLDFDNDDDMSFSMTFKCDEYIEYEIEECEVIE